MSSLLLPQKAVGAVALLIALLASASAAFAQTETGQIVGNVVDPNGAVVAGANVTVKSVATGREVTTTSNEEGGYTVTNLQPGLYDVTVQAQGFAPSTQRVQITVGGRLTLETNLSVTAIGGETVEVVAGGGVEVNTQNQELSRVISGTQIRELPTLTRNPYALVGLSGNVSPADPSGRGTGFAINGQRAASTNILLDGGENVDAFRATVGQSVPLDAVGEFRVITSNFSAEYGRASGGIVNVTTRSGSNDFNGTVYAFNRISRLASNGFARNAARLPKGVFTRNQFGYSLGGPMVENKAFFFSSTEWIRVRSTGDRVDLVATPELIAASAPATRAFFSGYQLAQPINGRVLTVSDVINSVGASTFTAGNAFSALPGNLPAFGEVRYSIPQDLGGGAPQNTYQTVNRVDWNITDRTQLYGRYALESIKNIVGVTSPTPYAGFPTAGQTFNQNYLTSLTHAFSSNLTSQTRLTYNRLNDSIPLGEQPPGPTLYLRTATTSFGGRPVALPGYLPFAPGTAIPFGGPQNVGQVAQDVNYTRGNHQFRFGGQYIYIQDNRTFGAYQNSVQTLGANEAQALSNLVLGQVLQFQAVVDPQGGIAPGARVNLPVQAPSFSRSNRYHEYALYLNDSWRVRRDVTLNLGLRYEFYGVQKNKDPELDSNFYYGSGASYAEQIRNGAVFRAPDSPVGGLWRPDKNNFAPRLGVAWDITGDGKTSLRGGYGVAYERNFGNVTFNVIQNPPGQAGIVIVAGSTPGFPVIPIQTNNLGPLAGTSGSVLLPGTLNVRHVDENVTNAYAHFWSASFERELMRGTVASVEYSGSAGRSQYSISNPNRLGSGAVYLNDPCATQAACRATLLNSRYFPLNTRGNLGRSDYDALILGLNSNNFRNWGLQFTANYTFSSTKDNLSTAFSESANNRNLGFLDPFNPDLDYGYADYDVRHRFSSSFNWEIPFARNADGFARQLLHGWTITGLFTARTGSPFTVFDCSRVGPNSICYRLVPTADVRFRGPDNPPPDPRTNPAFANRFIYIDLSNQTPGPYVNPITGNGEFGPFPENMTPKNAFRGPGFWNADASVFKNFHITEGTRLQLRAEVFNLFNHANLFVVGSQAQVTNSFGTDANGNPIRGVTATRDGRRNVQLAVKFIF